MRLGLSGTPRETRGPAPAPLLARDGARVVLGETGLGESVAPRRTTLFGPRGAHLFAADGPLFVCDTGHHRLLGFRRCPTEDGAPADLVIGQPSFESEGRNGRGSVTASSLNVPTGIAPYRRGLAVADTWNHRVLVWNELPEADNTPADLVLGQASFDAGEANRGLAGAAADTLHWPCAVLVVGERLVVADTGNRRVLVWDRLPTTNGAPADHVLGQPDFAARSDNGGEPSAHSYRWPHALAWHDGGLVVADAGNSRLLVFDGIPEPGTAGRIIGQETAVAVDHNRGRYWPTASALNMPYGVASAGDELLVADTASSRLLGFASLRSGAAERLTGQRTFEDKGDNRWSLAARDSLCWPYAISLQGRTAVIADSGNNRVLLWERA